MNLVNIKDEKDEIDQSSLLNGGYSEKDQKFSGIKSLKLKKSNLIKNDTLKNVFFFIYL
jgi:hypothetical protein